MNKTAIKLQQLAECAQNGVNKNKELCLFSEHDFANGKPERSYNQPESLLHLPFVNSSTKLRAICESLNINHNVDNGFCLTQSELNLIHQYSQKIVSNQRPTNTETAIWCISQQKGGSGKTTLSTTAAVGMATEFLGEYRIAFIDLDPQATGTLYLKPNFDDSNISVGDLLNRTFELEEDETYEDVCKKAFYPTNTPNLFVLGAREEDRYYETFVEERRQEANKKGEHYVSYGDLQVILDAVKDEFDTIFIDTTPYFSAATNAGHFVANNLLIPVRPSENDFDGGAKHLSHLALQYGLYANEGHKGYENIILQPMAVENNNAHVDMIHRIRITYTDNCSPYNFVESKAVTHCASAYCTIYDLSRSEYDLGSKASLKRAQDETRSVLRYIEQRTLAFWGQA